MSSSISLIYDLGPTREAITGFLPNHVQFCPSPVYPVLQRQSYDPLVFLHTALTLQEWVPWKHSFISVNTIMRYKSCPFAFYSFFFLITNAEGRRTLLIASEGIPNASPDYLTSFETSLALWNCNFFSCFLKHFSSVTDHILKTSDLSARCL